MKNQRTPPAGTGASPGAGPKPDYDKWAARDVWNLTQAAALLAGLDPSFLPELKDSNRIEAFERRRTLIEKCIGKDLHYITYQGPSGADDGHRLLPVDIVVWARNRGIDFPKRLENAVLELYPSRFAAGILAQRIADLRKKILELEEKHDAARAESDRLKQTVGSSVHSTLELQLLQQAIIEFWEKHDPQRPPKKETVTAWLHEREPGLSARMADAIDTIIRPVSAREGGKKKKRSRS